MRARAIYVKSKTKIEMEIPYSFKIKQLMCMFGNINTWSGQLIFKISCVLSKRPILGSQCYSWEIAMSGKDA